MSGITGDAAALLRIKMRKPSGGSFFGKMKVQGPRGSADGVTHALDDD